MQTRALGATDLRLTTLGLGTWAIGGGNWDFGWGPQDDAESEAAIRRALDLGINWIDTAPAYGLGHGETVVGRAIRGRRHEVIIATKCGLVWESGAHSVRGRLKADSVRRECEASLERLGVEHIDLYQIHWPNPDGDIEEAWAEIARLVEAGKVRHAGVSNFGVEQIERVRAIHPVASLQPPYNLLDRGVEAALLGHCARHGIGVVAYSPMASGLLTGKYTKAGIASLAPEDWRHRGDRFQEPELSANLDLARKLEAAAAAQGRSLGELAIAWVLRRPEVSAAIVGARRPAQIEQLAAAADWRLDGDLLEHIDALLAERDAALAR